MYIMWDIETTQEPDEHGYRTHKPNLVVAFDIIIKHRYIEDVEAFVDGLEPHVLKGDSCIEEYCQWVMSEESNIGHRKTAKGYDKTICIAHNSRGYDSRFVLKYLDSKSLIHETLRADGGSSIQFISVNHGRIIWIDSLNFFNEPLAKLSKTYGIKHSVKGYFPHGFNTREHDYYIGKIPDLMYYHPAYTKIVNHKGKLDFSEHQKLVDWWTEQKDNNVVFNMKEELLKYCIDDCKVLLKAVLLFRNIIINKALKTTTKPDGTVVVETLNIDPFKEAITIPSLASKINRDHVLPNTQLKHSLIQKIFNQR